MSMRKFTVILDSLLHNVCMHILLVFLIGTELNCVGIKVLNRRTNGFRVFGYQNFALFFAAFGRELLTPK